MKVFEILESIELSEKTLKKNDVKNTEKKLERDVTDSIGDSEVNFINDFLKKGEKIDGKTIKSIDQLLKAYKTKIGQGKARNDANIMMLAPILAAMQSELRK